MDKENIKIEKHIDALDGIRAIAIGLIVWFHLWEQSWLSPYITFNNKFTRYFGITGSNLATIVRFGYTAVELFILISAVVNFLPYARAIIFKTDFPNTKEFYKKRAIRILPSYFLNVAFMFIVAIIKNSYVGKTGFMLKDLFTHLTFTSIFFADTYRLSNLNGALWTVQVEVIFYIFMPLIAKGFRKLPAVTTAMLYAIEIISTNIIIYHTKDIWARNNYITTFTGLYANGMLICLIYYSVKRGGYENRATQIGGTLAAAGSYAAYVSLLNRFFDMERPYAQLTYRFALTFILSLFVLGIMFSAPLVKSFFSNRVFKFISGISYNLYIWHQIVMFFLKEHHIPYWSGDTLPNMAGNRQWQFRYTFLSLVDGLLVAVILTYLFEKSVTECLRKRFIDKKENADQKAADVGVEENIEDNGQEKA